MQICLVAPEGSRLGGEARRLGRPLFPPLGLMTVAALTPRHHSVTIIDEAVEPAEPDMEVDLVGLTAMTAAAPRAYELADQFRARAVPVVMGGMHASALPDEALEHVDAVVVGEAEELWPRLLDDLAAGDLQPVYRHDSYPDPRIIPPARRDLLDTSNYVAKHVLQASRGCPHACSFCAVSTFFGRTYRPRPVEHVIAEAAEIDDEPIVLVDDNIMGQPSYASRLFERWADLGKSFISQASTTMLKSPELIAEAARAGCKALFVGLESISPAQLAKIGKSFNPVDKYRELVQQLHDVGIAVVGSFMFGLDGDEEDVFERTAEFAEEAELDVGQFSILTPLPGTRLYEKLEREGRITERDWSKYDGEHCTFQPIGMTAEALESGFHWLYEHFYSWRSIMRRVGKRLTPLVWMVNGIYKRRVARWLSEVRSQPTG